MLRRYILAFLLLLGAWTVPALAGQAEDRRVIEAAARGDVEGVRQALESGGSPNAVYDPAETESISALLAALVSGSSEVRALLLERGADPRADEYSAFLFALIFEDSAAVRDFLAASPLQPGDPHFVEALLMRPSRVGAELFKRVLRVELGLETIPEGVAEQYFEQVMKELLAGSFALSKEDPAIEIFRLLRDAGSPLQPAEGENELISMAARSGDLLMIDALREAGVPLPPGWEQPELRQAALVGAAQSGNTQGVNRLLLEGANVFEPAPNDEYPLPYAVLFGREEILDALLTAGADPNLRGADQRSALDQAVEYDQAGVVRKLLDAGADPNMQDEALAWPLLRAAHAGALASACELIASQVNLNETGANGRTVLHDLTVIDGSSLFGPRPRRLYPNHLELVALLGANQFDFRAVDLSGRTPIGSIVAAQGAADLTTLEAFRVAGSPLTQDLLSIAAATGERDVLTWAIEKGAKFDTMPEITALAAANRDAESLLLLLEAGAPLPADADLRAEILVAFAARGEGEVVARLLALGVPANAASENETAIGAALAGGHGEVVRVLHEAGSALTSPRGSGSVVHDLVRADVEAERRGDEPLMAVAQQQSIAVLLDNGFDLALRDEDGRTVEEVASRAPGTLARWHAAIALAGSAEGGLHRAVRRNDLAALAAALQAGANIDALDGLGRSALTLALQLGHAVLADRLLAEGAAFTLQPRNAYQRADIAYASDPRLAPTFTLRLMSNRLLSFADGSSREEAEATLEKFRANIGYKPADTVWSVECTPCTGVMTLKGNERQGNLPLESARRDVPNGTRYWFRQYNIAPVRIVIDRPLPNTRGSAAFELTFDVTSSLTIPRCSFDFLSDAACYPEVEIANPNTPSEFLINTSDGPKPLPGAVIAVEQGGATREILPGETLAIDRSVGDVTISLLPVKSKIFAFHYEVLMGRGPTLEVADDIDDASRARTYGRIAVLADEFARLQATGGADTAVQAKTLASAIRVHSAAAVLERYPEHVRELLRLRATDIASLDSRVLELRNAVIAQSQMTPGEIDLLILRLDLLLSQSDAAGRPALEQIREGLVRARNAASDSTTAVDIFRENFYSDIDRVVRDYQGLILEYAQYARPAEYAAVLSDTVRTRVLAKLAPGDVFIEDDALDDNGAALRSAFGLPAPGSR